MRKDIKMLSTVLFILFVIPFIIADQDNVLRFKSQKKTQSNGELSDLLRALLVRGRPGNQNLPLSILKDLGFNKGKGSEKPKLKAFKYENCGGVETITDLVLSPDPLQFPGEIDLTIDGTLSKTLEANLSASLNMTKKIAGIPIHLPCVDGIGSCNYTDLCGMLAQIPECPPELVAQGIDCKCPLKKGTYKVSNEKFDIAASFLPSGDYEIRGKVFDNTGTMLACLDIQATVA